MIATDKRLFKELGIQLTDYCSCGRSTNAVHCPFCGSTDVRRAMRQSKLTSVLLPDGTQRSVKSFTCRRCGDSFQENDCFRDCRAFAIAWKSEQRTANEVEHQIKRGGPITPAMREALVAIAKKRPKYRQTIQDTLAEAGPGLLERVDIDRGHATVAEANPLEAHDREVAAAKLFEPPKLDEDSDDSTKE
jgi:hypothetical protein